MNKYIKFFEVKMYIISPVTCYDIDHVESKSSGLNGRLWWFYCRDSPW